MLQRLYIDNYKCLVNFEVRLRELSLLLGRNGTGKTSVLDVAFALRQLLSGEARVTDADVFPTRTLTLWQTRPLQTFEVEVALDTERLRYRLEVEHEPTRRLARIALEELSVAGGPLFRCKAGEVQLYRDDHSEGPTYSMDWTESALARVANPRYNERLMRFRDFMRKMVVCSFHPPSFHAESSAEDTLLQRDARNFADWYRHATLEHPGLIHGLNEALKEVMDGFSSIRMERVGRETRALMVVFDHGGREYSLPFDEISDGQRALVALYGLIHLSANQGYTFFLDEPDNYVALPEIQPWLVDLEDACGQSVAQAVLCSHHPELIDFLGTDSSVFLRREASGVVTARRFDSELLQEGLKVSEMLARGWAE